MLLILVRNKLEPFIPMHHSESGLRGHYWGKSHLALESQQSLRKIKCQELYDVAYCLTHNHLPRYTYHSSYLALSEHTLSLSPLPFVPFYPGLCHVPSPVPYNIYYSSEKSLST